jgi:tRNA A37 threonylcarbamoyladenosine biosynthesis protein TsaE
VVEWADRAMGLLPVGHLLIELHLMSTNRRSLEMKASGARYMSLTRELTIACSSRS